MTPRDLRQLAHLALSDFGVSPSRLTHAASRHNDVFRVDTRARGRFALRIQNDLMSDAEARSQLTWLEALANVPKLTVPAPLRTRDGRPFTHLEAKAGTRRAVLLRWLPGRTARTRGEGV